MKDINELKTELGQIFKGDIDDTAPTIDKYSRDASLFKVKPALVLFPKDSADLQNLVQYIDKEKGNHPELSITGRSAGTDMTGGPLNESIILDFTKYFKAEHVDLDSMTADVEPGVFYRDFEVDTLPKHISLPVYPASKQLAALGGMVMNNAAGEKTLRYGQMRDFVEEVSMVLADGKEYTFKEISEAELEKKIAQNDFEGKLYQQIYELVKSHEDLIAKAEPTSSKNSAGYALWRIWNKEKGTFNLAQLFVGSQGTLGLLTKVKVRLMKDKPHKKLIVVFLNNWDLLPSIVNSVLPFQPESMEAFDDTTLKLGLKFMPEIAKKAHEKFLTFAMRFLPETWIGIQMFGLPKLILLIELAEETEEEITTKTKNVMEALQKYKIHMRLASDEHDADKYWIMRRESFNLLRQHVHGKRTAPFIDDFGIDAQKMPEFLPKLLAILKKYKIKANIAGHAGNGNYHIIPLMDLTQASERAKIVPVSKEVYDLILSYGGTITAEHNDGIIRTPFVEKMFGHSMYQLFVEVKKICDPQNIFNPGKKVGGSMEYLESHIDTR
jgi:FAD/FMN-containing dehydrogenase